MKTYKNLYPRVHDFANLYRAFRQARRGKRDRVAVASFEFDLEDNLLRLQAELRDSTYRPGPYTNFHIQEPKRRLVSAAPFRDRGDGVNRWMTLPKQLPDLPQRHRGFRVSLKESMPFAFAAEQFLSSTLVFPLCTPCLCG